MVAFEEASFPVEGFRILLCGAVAHHHKNETDPVAIGCLGVVCSLEMSVNVVVVITVGRFFWCRGVVQLVQCLLFYPIDARVIMKSRPADSIAWSWTWVAVSQVFSAPAFG